MANFSKKVKFILILTAWILMLFYILSNHANHKELFYKENMHAIPLATRSHEIELPRQSDALWDSTEELGLKINAPRDQVMHTSRDSMINMSRDVIKLLRDNDIPRSGDEESADYSEGLTLLTQVTDDSSRITKPSVPLRLATASVSKVTPHLHNTKTTKLNFRQEGSNYTYIENPQSEKNQLKGSNSSPREITDNGDLPLCTQESRKSLLKNMCAKRNHTDDRYFKERPRWLIDQKHKLGYCFIYKAGSTSWIQTLLAANGVRTRDQLNKIFEMNPIGNSAHFPGTQNSAHLPLQRYSEKVHHQLVKFLVVRHPFDRLISAYYQKFATDVDNWFRPLRNALRAKYAYRNRTQRVQPQKRGEYHSVTFAEFVNFVIDEYYGRANLPTLQKGHQEHFVSYFAICDPCSIPYDYILRTETNSQDSKYILDKLNLSKDFMQDLNFNAAPQRTHIDSVQKYLPEFRTLSEYQIKELFHIYRHDLDLFGYGLNFNKKTTCSIKTDNGYCC